MLITDPHLESADDFYEALIDAHRDLDAAQSHSLNAKLVLLLANHVGRQEVLKEALTAARRNTLQQAAAARRP
jgi:adenosine deaminase